MEKADFSCQLKSGPKSLQQCDTGAVREVISLSGALYLLEVWCCFHVGGVSSFIYLCQVPRSVPGVIRREICDYEMAHTPAIFSWCEAYSALFLGCYGSLNMLVHVLIKLRSHFCSKLQYKRDFPDTFMEPLAFNAQQQPAVTRYFFFTKKLIGP